MGEGRQVFIEVPKVMDAAGVMTRMREQQIKWIDLQFVDIIGSLQHVTVPVHEISEADFTDGVGKLDGSSIKGFKEIYESDMLLIPIPKTYVKIPWEKDTARLYCEVKEAGGGPRFTRDSRYTAEKAEQVLAKEGFDVSYWGPEAEFFVFDEVHYDTSNPYKTQSYNINSIEASWHPTGKTFPIGFKAGYYPVPPADTLQDFRRQACQSMQEDFGIVLEAHHHEVATAGQCEIDMRYDSMVTMADALVTYKYVIKNLAFLNGKIATFMPKPIYGDNASGMHVHQSMWNAGKNKFYDASEPYAQLSQTALYYLGGLIEHGRSLSAIVSPTTNSYRRLVPGYEAPVYLAYSKRNRSAAIRIPVYFTNEKAKRLEYRPPDPSCNPYLAFAAMAAAGLDGIRKKISPSNPVDVNIYDLTSSKRRELGIKELPGSLHEAIHELETDHDYLKPIFSEDLVDTYIEMKRKEADSVSLRPTPFEFELYLNA